MWKYCEKRKYFSLALKDDRVEQCLRSCGSKFQIWGPKQEKVQKPYFCCFFLLVFLFVSFFLSLLVSCLVLVFGHLFCLVSLAGFRLLFCVESLCLT